MVNNFFGITDVGRQRTNNEDTFIVQPVLDKRYILACVIDGVGGYAGGEVAADIARKTITNYFSVASGDINTMMKEAIVAANEKIVAEKTINNAFGNMACVLTLAVVDEKNNMFHYAHVGDTRLYLLRDDSIIKVTKDHSFVGYLEDNGRISEEAAMIHPKRNEINKALGFADIMVPNDGYIDTGESPFLPGDRLLLCSDGLTDLVDAATLKAMLSSSDDLEKIGQALIDEANSKGGKDNITVVLVKNGNKGAKMRAVKPAIKITKKEPSPLKEENESIYKEQVVPVTTPEKVKSYKGAAIILSILCLLFLAGYVWLYFHQNKPVEEEVVTAPNPQLISVRQQNLQEKLLYDSINKSGFTTVTLPDSVYAQPISISNTLFIQKDSVHIKGLEKVTLIADSLFSGPAILLSPGTKYVLLENLVFNGFDIGVITGNKALHLKNVQFLNCRVPLQYQFVFPDSVVVSTTKNGNLFKIDSLSK